MGVFIPRDKRTCRRQTHHVCRWCGAHKLRKHLYKLRDGPIDWWFCNDDHALEWLDYRHRTPVINAMLRLVPSQRNLGGKSIEQWVTAQWEFNPGSNQWELNQFPARVVLADASPYAYQFGMVA